MKCSSKCFFSRGNIVEIDSIDIIKHADSFQIQTEGKIDMIGSFDSGLYTFFSFFQFLINNSLIFMSMQIRVFMHKGIKP